MAAAHRKSVNWIFSIKIILCFRRSLFDLICVCTVSVISCVPCVKNMTKHTHKKHMKGVDAKTDRRQSDVFRIFGFSYNSLSSLNVGETRFGKNQLHPHLL